MQLDPIVQKMISQTKHPAKYSEYGATVCNRFITEKQNLPLKQSNVVIEERVISIRPSGYVTMRIFKPMDNDKLLTPIIYLPGPVWTSRIPQLHDPLLEKMSDSAQVAVLLINFSLSPAAKYPAALEECYCVLK